MIYAKALLFSGVDTVGIGAVEVPEPGPGEVLVETLYSCISPGTELRCLSGTKDGSDNWPYIPGYAMTGTVVAVGDGVRIPVGTRVYCDGTRKVNVRRQWGGHISHAVLEEDNIYPLPDGLSPRDASLAALVAITYHGVRLSYPQPQETVAVVGLGPIGQLSARLHAITGARVIGGDLSPVRVKALESVGVEALVTSGGLAASFRQRLPEGADVVVDCTGAPGVIQQAIEIARDLPWDDSPTPGPRYVIQGSYGGDFSLPYSPAFMREMTFLLPRNRQPRDVRTVLNLMASGKLKVADLISDIRPPEDAPAVYAALKDPNSGLLTAAFQWR